MTSFANPSAAISTILARMTSRYGDVYRRALASRSRRSSADSFIVNGLFLGIPRTPPGCIVAERAPRLHQEYVTVFVE
jgi:hypothetical protein